MFDLGDVWPLAVDARDPDGALVNADSVTLTITKPDGTTTSPVVTNPPSVTGRYTCDVLPDVAGRWQARWLLAWSSGSTAAYTDVCDVRPAEDGQILSLASAKAHLNSPATSTTDDEEIRGFIAAVTEIVESDPDWGVGPVVVRTYTERVCDGPSWWLQRSPAIALVSVATVFTSGTVQPVEGLVLEAATGRVQRRDGMALTGGPWDVVYTAGRQIILPNVSLAAKIILAHMWETQRGGVASGLRFNDDAEVVQPGYMIPNRAKELLVPHGRGPLVA